MRQECYGLYNESEQFLPSIKCVTLVAYHYTVVQKTRPKRPKQGVMDIQYMTGKVPHALIPLDQITVGMLVIVNASKQLTAASASWSY